MSVIILAYQSGTVYEATMTARRHASDIRSEPEDTVMPDTDTDTDTDTGTGNGNGNRIPDEGEPITAAQLSNLRG